MTVTFGPSSVQIDLLATTTLSYAMAHNRLPVVHSVTLTCTGGPVDGALLTLRVEDSEGTLSAPSEHLVDLTPLHQTILAQVDVRLDPAAMLHVAERRPGRIVARVEAAGTVVAEAAVPVDVLAAHQWLREPPTLSLELLAAFVMPNSPAIGVLVGEAAQLLEQRTGSPSIQGYQSGAERVDEIARAIYDAMAARRIRYSEPPASWADVGQKVRTPAEVLDGRVGTCLDTVLVMAAALEQAGIRPLLWMVQGHAFLGYWREERALDAIATLDVADVVNYVDLGLIRLVETTMVTAADVPAPFETTHRPPYITYLTGDLERVYGVVDVWTARRNEIVPLPAQTRTADGHVQVVEYRPAEHSTPAIARQPGPALTTVADKPVPPRVQQWKNALLDLSLRNRLINFTPRHSITLAVPEGRLALIEDALHDKRPVNLLPSDQLDDVHAARGVRTGRDLEPALLAELFDRKTALYTDVTGLAYQARLRALAYKARTIVEETGANNLYLALGTLVWDLEGRQLRSPLVLVPVRLVTRSRQQTYRLEPDESGTSTPNYCLLEKLRQVHQDMTVPGLAEPVLDESGIDLDAAFHAVRVAIAERSLPYRVEEGAALAILQFAKFRLWKDLDEHWETMLANPLVHHLTHTPTDPFEAGPAGSVGAAPDLDELATLCPVPADATQLDAVAAAVAGSTFVLEGPPGTGKSQTITNVVTRAVAAGRRVLFVAEKRAALDVVRERLEAVGMGAFSLDLHDKASKPALVRAQVRAAIDLQVALDQQGLAAQQEDLRSSRRNLARYAQRLHEPNGAGLSFYSSRTRLLALLDDEHTLFVPPDLVDQTTEVIERLRHQLAALPDVADLARPRLDHPWAFVDSTDGVELERVRSAARDVDGAAEVFATNGLLSTVVAAATTGEELETLASLLEAAPTPLAVLDQTRTREWRQASSSLHDEVAAFVAAAHPGLDIATPQALDLPLADLHAQAQAAASSGWFGRKKRLRAVADQLAPALRAGASVAPKRVPELTGALLQLQSAVRGLAERASGVAGLTVPPGWNPMTDAGRELLDRQAAWLTWASEVVDTQDAFALALRSFLTSPPTVEAASARAVRTLSDAVTALGDATRATSDSVARWAGGVGLVARWSMTRGERNLDEPALHSLRRWLALLTELAPLAAVGMQAAHRQLMTGEVPAEAAVRAFDRGLAETSAQERLSSTGLDAFDAAAHERTIGRFTRSSAAVRSQMTTAIPGEVLAARRFQPGAERGQMGALQRELAKQRGGLAVRSLLTTYGDLITALMPCVLVSPDSLARFFPVVQNMFDVVVFDEASQIRVADAVGAMGRSGSVVVVGDSKQMPPTSFAEPSSGSDEDEVADESLAVEDEESILTECVQARVPQRWLSWHYRSQDESLIAFSNAHYYEGRLSSFPAPTSGTASSAVDGHGVNLVRVQGQFHRSGKGKLLRTNPVEAEAIVAEIRRRMAAADGAPPSVGVVTFNQQQRAYIEALIRDSGDDRLVEALDGTDAEGLFIKNLENVQGDERDVILFSTAFSINERGYLPLNFGPLNRGGGERRLNVAITRARRQVVIFSSFDPAQLRAEETSSIGIKHLRAYLDLAAAGTSALERAKPRAASVDRHRDEVADSLRARGLVVHTDVGLSDFRVDISIALPEAPHRPQVAVLLDGPGWAARRTVGDRDGLPVDVLSKMLRWPAVERVWLPAWLADRDAVVQRLESAARGTLPQRVSAGPAATLTRAVPATPTTPAAQLLPGETEFLPWSPGLLGSRTHLDSLPAPDAARRVAAALRQAVDAEGPIQLDRLSKAVAGAFDLSRVNAARTQSILDQLPADIVVDRADGFAWPTSIDQATWPRFRTSPTASRPVEQISLRELGNAMVGLCSASGGIRREDVLRETVIIFGGRRLTPGISGRLERALATALADHRLDVRADGVLVPVA